MFYCLGVAFALRSITFPLDSEDFSKISHNQIHLSATKLSLQPQTNLVCIRKGETRSSYTFEQQTENKEINIVRTNIPINLGLQDDKETQLIIKINLLNQSNYKTEKHSMMIHRKISETPDILLILVHQFIKQET